MSLSLSVPPKLAFALLMGDTYHCSAVFHVFHVYGVKRVTFHSDDVTCSRDIQSRSRDNVPEVTGVHIAASQRAPIPLNCPLDEVTFFLANQRSLSKAPCPLILLGSGGVKCLLNEARKQPHYDPKNEASFMTELATIDPNIASAHLRKGNNSSGKTAQTKYGEIPVGSFLSCQVSFTESNFSAEADLNAVPRNNVLCDSITAYPMFPLANENPMITPRELSSEPGPGTNGCDRCEMVRFYCVH